MANTRNKGVIPFAKEAYKRLRASTPEQTVLNFIVERDGSSTPQSEDEKIMLLQRPGLDAYYELPGPVQGLYTTDNPGFNYTFGVAGNKLYSFNSSGSVELGTLSGSTSKVSFAANFDRLVVVNYPKVYCYGASSTSTFPTFREIVLPDLFGTGPVRAVDVAHLNGYLVIACEDGTYVWIAPGENGVDPLNFATAESDPDGLVGVDVVHNNLVFFGKRSIETWQPSGNADLPFQRAVGQDYERGCFYRETIVHMDNSVFWVGDDNKVYRADNVPKRISTDGIDERLRLASGATDAWSFSFDGHLFYVLSIPGQGTFAYDVATDIWSQFSSQGSLNWKPWVGCALDADFICGDRTSGKVWKVSSSATDDNVAFSRRASATVALPSSPKRADTLSLDVGTTGETLFKVKWADADESLDGQPQVGLFCNPGSHILTYPRMGAARNPYRTVEVEVNDPVVVRISGGRVGESWR